MDINGRILHSTIKLDSVSHLLTQLGHAQHKGITDTIDPDVLYGLGYMMEDISDALKPILHAPNEVGGWSPREGSCAVIVALAFISMAIVTPFAAAFLAGPPQAPIEQLTERLRHPVRWTVKHPGTGRTARMEGRCVVIGSLKHLTDEQLVEQVPTDDPGDRLWNQAPYLLEMQRRHIDAIRDFNIAAGRQADVMITLTRWITGLTVVLLVLTAVLVWKEVVHG